ncbi:uracil-DNA glycosylase [Sphingomonas sp. ERG5]|uniref:uracil-DNA glycosylase n=1 Tax=Sphingomonas sp. ERG5 TaxID=1381597 RepID=UPI00054B00B6|nr:uracil-DNA glycosylase [Sphingomonas sp. ERG5]
MGADQNFDWRHAAASAIDWWREAGVDATIDEAPRDWLARVEAPPVVEDQAAVAAPFVLPDTLEAFAAWRSGPDAPEAGWPEPMIAAQGTASSDLMVLVDVPEREDAQSGMLMSGAAGRLFDRMLAAIGRDRSSIYLAALCTARPVSGRISPEIGDRLNELARHHVALAGPKRVLLLGNAPSRALLGADAARARGGLRTLNLNLGTVEIEIDAVASFHPRFLLEKPAFKAEAWKDLQMLIGGLES